MTREEIEKLATDYLNDMESTFDMERLFDFAIQMTEPSEDLKDALHIAQTDRDKWKIRAQKLAKIIGIRDCDIDEYKQEHCEDAISRQAAIEQSIVLRDISNPDKEWEVVTVATIKHLKQVQPEQKEITMEDVEAYCKPRNLVVLTKELFDKMSNTADEIYLYLKDKERR